MENIEVLFDKERINQRVKVLADTLYKKGRYSESLKLYSKMEEKNSNKLENTYNKGVSEYRLKQFDKASESFAKVASNTKDKNLKIKSLFN